MALLATRSQMSTSSFGSIAGGPYKNGSALPSPVTYASPTESEFSGPYEDPDPVRSVI